MQNHGGISAFPDPSGMSPCGSCTSNRPDLLDALDAMENMHEGGIMCSGPVFAVLLLRWERCCLLTEDLQPGSVRHVTQNRLSKFTNMHLFIIFKTDRAVTNVCRR